MNAINHTVRETRELRPRPHGDYDGTTRVGLWSSLLAKHEDPRPDVESRMPVVRRVIGFLGLTLQLVVATQGTLTIRSTGPRLTPADAVAVLRSSRSDRDRTDVVGIEPSDGPTLVVAPCQACDVQAAIANAEAWRRAGFVRLAGRFYARGSFGTIPTSPRDAGPSNGSRRR